MFVKLISKTEIEKAPQNKGAIINYYADEALMRKDGYKPLIGVVRPNLDRKYHIEYVEETKEIKEIIVYDETEEEYTARKIEEAKQLKYLDNTQTANFYLKKLFEIEVGTPKKLGHFLYDDKTERNLNSAYINLLSGLAASKNWIDEQGVKIVLELQDISYILNAFNEHANNIWGIWGKIKTQIDEAKTLEEVQNIEVNYEVLNA